MAQQQLARQIGLGSAIAVVVGSTIGSGIFKSPSGIAEKLPGPLPMLMVWVIGGLIVLCGALSMAELGSAYPYSGGVYVYLREAYGRLTAFLFGWAQLTVIRPSSIGALAVVFGQFTLRLFKIDENSNEFVLYSSGLGILAIIVCAFANARGVKFGTRIQNFTTIAKTGGLILLVILALVIALPKGGGNFTPLVPPGSFQWSAFGLALVSVMWAYDGWADGSYVGGEIKDPRKNLPKAILLGTLGIIAVYLLANVGYLAVFDVAKMAASKQIAADAMQAMVGLAGVTFIVATVMLSTFGTLNGTLLTSPRIFFALAEDRMFPAWLSEIHPKYGSPHRSIYLCAGLGILYVIVATIFAKSSTFSALTDAFVIAVVPFYSLAVGALFVLRKRMTKPADAIQSDSLVDPIDDGTFEAQSDRYAPEVKTLGYPITPLIFIVAIAALLVNSLIDPSSQVQTLITLGIVAVGFPLYWFAFKRAA